MLVRSQSQDGLVPWPVSAPRAMLTGSMRYAVVEELSVRGRPSVTIPRVSRMADQRGHLGKWPFRMPCRGAVTAGSGRDDVSPGQAWSQRDDIPRSRQKTHRATCRSEVVRFSSLRSPTERGGGARRRFRRTPGMLSRVLRGGRGIRGPLERCLTRPVPRTARGGDRRRAV